VAWHYCVVPQRHRLANTKALVPGGRVLAYAGRVWPPNLLGAADEARGGEATGRAILAIGLIWADTSDVAGTIAVVTDIAAGVGIVVLLISLAVVTQRHRRTA
jgi:hypothetical protein